MSEFDTKLLKVGEWSEGRTHIGDWMETFTGRRVYPLSLTPADIYIGDIAHALSLLCRYNGHCKRFYSVGLHSLNCLEHARREEYSPSILLRVLLHDATEAYVADVPRPLKPYLGGYKKIEAGAKRAILTWAGLPARDATADLVVKWVDDAQLAEEAERLMISRGVGWQLPQKPSGVWIGDMPPGDVRDLFMQEFWHLYKVVNKRKKKGQVVE